MKHSILSVVVLSTLTALATSGCDKAEYNLNNEPDASPASDMTSKADMLDMSDVLDTSPDTPKDTSPKCGNKKMEGDEECDLGDQNSDAPNARCRLDCKYARCGDGVVDSDRLETCDDGNDNNEDECLNTCQPNICGDKTVNRAIDPATNQPFEVCDDGDQDNTNACTTACTTCGNGFVDEGEECDSGEFPPRLNDGCNAQCQKEDLFVCKPNEPCYIDLNPSSATALGVSTALDVFDDGDDVLIAVGKANTSVFVYRGTASKSLHLEQELIVPSNDITEFAENVAIHGNTLVASGVQLDGSGAVYEYEYDTATSTWSLKKTHVAPVSAPGDGFGSELALNTQFLAVGAESPNQIHMYQKQGAQFLFFQSLMSQGRQRFCKAKFLVDGRLSKLCTERKAGYSWEYYIYSSSWALDNSITYMLADDGISAGVMAVDVGADHAVVYVSYSMANNSNGMSPYTAYSRTMNGVLVEYSRDDLAKYSVLPREKVEYIRVVGDYVIRDTSTNNESVRRYQLSSVEPVAGNVKIINSVMKQKSSWFDLWKEVMVFVR